VTGDPLLVYFSLYDLLIGIGFLVVLLPILWWRKHNLSYLLFFSLFWMYLLAVVQVIFFPFVINTGNGGAAFSPSINLIPFYFGSCFTHMPELCIRSLIENMILTLPFGFGLYFLLRARPKNILWVAIAVGLGLESFQLLISFVFRSGFRAVDINDAILNAAGVLLGYALFRVFAWAYLKITGRYQIKHKGLFADIYEVVLRTQASD
jgi:glycopeptide antibiotics resistance protein